LKSDTTYIVKFNTGDNSYQIYKDADNDMVADAGEEITSPFPAKIIFSLPSPTPSSRPDNVTGTPSNSVEDDWAAQLEILNDDMASINSGRIFLSSPIIEKIGYCIQVKDNTQTVKLFKWTGSQWNEM